MALIMHKYCIEKLCFRKKKKRKKCRAVIRKRRDISKIFEAKLLRLSRFQNEKSWTYNVNNYNILTKVSFMKKSYCKKITIYLNLETLVKNKCASYSCTSSAHLYKILATFAGYMSKTQTTQTVQTCTNMSTTQTVQV